MTSGQVASGGVSYNGGTPISHPKIRSFLVGKPMVVGETHHFRKQPYGTSPPKILDPTDRAPTRSFCASKRNDASLPW